MDRFLKSLSPLRWRIFVGLLAVLVVIVAAGCSLFPQSGAPPGTSTPTLAPTSTVASSSTLSATLPSTLAPPTETPSPQPSSTLSATSAITPTLTSTITPTLTATPSLTSSLTATTIPAAPTTAMPTPTSVTPTPTPSSLASVPPTPTYTPAVITDWQGEYFSNADLAGAPTLVRNDADINFNWGTGSPDPSIPANYFSVRWTRFLYFGAGTYTFFLTPDDGARLFIDSNLVLNMWSLGAARTQSVDVFLAAGTHLLEVDYFQATGYASIAFSWEQVVVPASTSGWRGEYYSNRYLEGAPTLVRYNSEIDFDWGDGSPDPSIPDNNYSIRWTRRIDFDKGIYRFTVRVDDGVRLWVDGDLLIDQWHEADTTYNADIYLSDDHHDVRVEYFKAHGSARIKVSWKRLSATETPTRTPTLTRTRIPPTRTETEVHPTPTHTRTPERTSTETEVRPTPTHTRTPERTRTETEARPTPTHTRTPTPTRTGEASTLTKAESYARVSTPSG